MTRVVIIVEGSRVVDNTVIARVFPVIGGGGIFVHEGTLRIADTTVANNTVLLITTRYDFGQGGE